MWCWFESRRLQLSAVPGKQQQMARVLEPLHPPDLMKLPAPGFRSGWMATGSQPAPSLYLCLSNKRERECTRQSLELRSTKGHDYWQVEKSQRKEVRSAQVVRSEEGTWRGGGTAPASCRTQDVQRGEGEGRRLFKETMPRFMNIHLRARTHHTLLERSDHHTQQHECISVSSSPRPDPCRLALWHRG